MIRNSSEAVALQDKATLTHVEQARIIGQVNTNWDPTVAGSLAQANLRAVKKADKGSVFILAPNDGTARAIADVFRADRDVKSYLVTGQDAQMESIQYILDGKQSMTVMKDVRTLVKDAVSAAVAYFTGGVPEQTTTYDTSKIPVPSRPTVTFVVVKSNVKELVIDSGFLPASDFTGLP